MTRDQLTQLFLCLAVAASILAVIALLNAGTDPYGALLFAGLFILIATISAFGAAINLN